MPFCASTCSSLGMRVCTGLERFRVLSVKQERPVLVCEVEVLSEEDDTTTTVSTLHASGQASAVVPLGCCCSLIVQMRSLHARHQAFAWYDKAGPAALPPPPCITGRSLTGRVDASCWLRGSRM